jgi:hypothetical protein
MAIGRGVRWLTLECRRERLARVEAFLTLRHERGARAYIFSAQASSTGL